MVNLEAVTLYHLTDEEAGIFARTVYHGSVYRSEAVKPEKAGFAGGDVYKIRIPSTEQIPVTTSDYVYIGVGPDVPQTAECKRIQKVCRNLRGVLPHVRIEAV